MRPIVNFYIRLLLFSFCLISVNYPIVAAVYKWVDEDGKTIYSQTPPPGDTEVDIIKTPAQVDTSNALKAMQDDINRVDSLRETRLNKAEDKQKIKEDLAFRQENCRRSQARLASYSVPRARILQADGSRIRPDEETRQKELIKSREMIQEWCD